jgi:plastocyanin
LVQTRHRLALLAAGLALASLPSCRALSSFHPWRGPDRGRLLLELSEAWSRETGSVVFLEPVSADPGMRRGVRVTEIANDGASFRPALTVVSAGDQVRFANRGGVAHRIFVIGQRGRRERLLEPGGRSAPLRIATAGEHRFYCSLHPDESFVVFAAPSRHFVVPDGGRSHHLEDIPTGEYRVGWWREADVRSLGVVEIRAGETARYPATTAPRSQRP